jgi:hypothetical protein
MAKKDALTHQVQIRITERDRERWKKQAARSRRRLSDWIRVVVNQKIEEGK